MRSTLNIKRKQIEASLIRKGFVKEGGDHEYFYHEIDGKRTSAWTKVSRGTRYKDYSINLLKAMKIQLRLDTLEQLRRLLECPMGADEYNELLKKKKVF